MIPTPPPTETIVDTQTGKLTTPWYHYLAQNNSGVITSQDFDTRGDGVVDDTGSLQKAIAAVAGTGKILLLLPGTYMVQAGKLQINDAITIAGSRDAIIKNSDGSGITLGVYADNVTLYGFTIDGGNSNSTVAAGYAASHQCLYVSGADSSHYIDNILIDNLQIKNCGYIGIETHFTEDMIIRNNRVTRCGYAGIGMHSPLRTVCEGNYVNNIYPGQNPGNAGSNCYGIFASRDSSQPVPTEVIITRNVVDGVTWEGIDEHDGVQISINDNIVTSCGTGIACEHHTSGAPGSDISVTNNRVEGYGEKTTIETVDYPSIAGIVCNGGVNTDQGAGLLIHGNYVKNIGDTRSSPGASGGIRASNWARFSVQNNVVYFCYRHGIILTDDGTDSMLYGTVSNNVVDETQIWSAVQHDIYLTSRVLCLASDNVTHGGGDGTTQVGAPTYTSTLTDNLDIP